ncbi:hypothetical protein AOQ84DRAFT_425240 [Glonium stellatum]|uniref:AAA+ ATPase domain-containing protein n=1 Tax=Glonium stellatum TaxID=574774 RepID=A0A8E2JVV0_9PEZI|nr:hypothetical protein AOQ84DRAFT_425240 [Glonium stellatum]
MANGANGFSSPPASPRAYFPSKLGYNGISAQNSTRGVNSHSRVSSMNHTVRHNQFSGSYKISLVQETASALKRKSMSELGAGVSQNATNVSFINLIEAIRSERLATLPHKGSTWDKVLIRAQYFAEQLHAFEVAIQGFALDSNTASQIGYGHARLLLELGHENSTALDKAFGFFYKCSLTASSLLDQSELLGVTSDTREQLCMMYTDLLTLVTDVAIRFYKTANAGMMSSSVSFDMYEVFGDTIETFRSRQVKLTEAIWSYQIEDEGLNVNEALDVKMLSRWLAPQDHVLASLSRDHTTFADHQAEFTCLWFQKHLSRFIQSSNNHLTVTGQPGCGKTVLAASIVERLQRPLGRKSFSTLFCSINSSIPSQASVVNVVKSLLYQLLNQRVGNMRTYHALVHAYEQARCSNNADAYEEHLWQALADALKHPLENANDLVIIVDGVDEVFGGKTAAQTLLEKLFGVVSQGKGVKLIALSQSLSTTSHGSGSQLAISRDDTHDDIHAVALRSLRHCHHLHGKAGPEQESILGRIIQAADGSFLWAILACELLMLEKSQENFMKAVESFETSRPSIQDITLKLISALDPSTNAKTILSWLVAAERPFTLSEISSLFSVDYHRGTVLDKGVDVHSTIQSLKPILSIHEDIIRLRHHAVNSSLQTLIDQGKIQMPIKDRQMDLVLRTLTYAKMTLREKREPTLEISDQGLADRLFHRHHFLEYVVRYWVFHLNRSSIAPKKPGDFNLTAEVQKVFPDTTTLSILEKLCWEAQIPTPQALDLHIMVGRLRRQILTEHHPVVLQSYLTCATYYDLLSNPTESGKYYYMSTTVSRKVLSNFHPLTVECANRFLRITETMTSTSRTEIMTHREQTLLILIEAYEHQYGATSEIVIRTKTTLAELYMHIHEEHRATELFQAIHEATVKHYGKNSNEARGVSDRLGVVLGKGKHDKVIETYTESLFTDSDEEDVEESLDKNQITIIIQKAQACSSRGDISMAEQIYVELWQRLSERCRTTLATEWHERKIDVVLAYTQFLKSQKRESETSAILTCLWQEYEHHELSFSESIISRLTEVAKTMKSVGGYTAALSIFKHASSYYKNVRKEESHSFTEIQQEISVTSTEIVKHTLTTTTTTESTSTVSESIFQEVFQSMISDESKSIESTTMTLAKRLTIKYMEQKKWSEATTIIRSTLHRTWSSFLSSSVHDVTLTSTFLQESIELAERLAECYLQQRQIEKVEDVYIRLFRAVLVSKQPDNTLLEKVKWLLINFYDKHGYPDRAISIFQDVLVVYRKIYGPSHEITIQTLYALGSRCREHARGHPYWIEYYQQIVTSLNKDSDVCHINAMEAITIVANSYWEERRYAEAVQVFAVLWNTFVHKTSEYKQFTDTKLIQTLYERYFQCLEETRADWDMLYRVSTEYYETCSKKFGASSSLTVEATLALARVSQKNEKHSSQAISLYEQVFKSSSSTTVSKTEIEQTLSTLYIRQITSESSSSTKTETIERATIIYLEQFSEMKSKYGYSHQMTLSHLRELSMLYVKQQKTELAVKELVNAVVQINTHESSSQKMLESGRFIAETFHACNQVSRCRELVLELHRQIIAKDTRNSSKWSFDLKDCGRASLVFLAALEYHTRTDVSVTFSEIMADIIAEAVYYEKFRRAMKANQDLDKIVLAAAPLRWFLVKRNLNDFVASLEDEVVQLFMQRDITQLKLLSKASPRIFIVAILEHLGNRKSKNFVRSVILASNDRVAVLTKTKKFPEAYDVANCAFIFAVSHDGYSGPKAIGHGFKLASYIVGRDGERCPDEGLRKQMLQLSNQIVKEILNICKRTKINFAQVQLPELNQLVILLGEQQDYETLEWLLTALWSTRDAQRTWPSQVLLNLGRRLICARYLAGHPIKAIRLCEDIAYNMRRVHGARHPATLETYTLLAQLYTSTGHYYQKEAGSNKSSASLANEYFKKALLVHEDTLRLLVSDGANVDYDYDDDEDDSCSAILAEHGVSVNGDHQQQDELEPLGEDGKPVDKAHLAATHLRLLKFAFQRFGGWPKAYGEYERLNADVFRMFGGEMKGTEGVEKWQAKGFGAGKAESEEGAFTGLKSWEFLDQRPEMRVQARAVEAEEEEL